MHATSASRVADDVVVAVEDALDPFAFHEQLAPLDARLLELGEVDAHELVDPVTRAVEAAGGVSCERRRASRH